MAEPGGYESGDVSIRGVWLSALALLLMLVLVLSSAGWLQRLFSPRRPGVTQPLSAAQTDDAGLPPPPRLQAAPQADLQALRASEDAILNSYGWVDKAGGIVRIPIERAMQLVVEQGLPLPETKTGETQR
jgi:hypothetical protein